MGIPRFHHIKGKINPADILSKHYSHGDVWPTLEPIFVWKGTVNLESKDVKKKKKKKKEKNKDKMEETILPTTVTNHQVNEGECQLAHDDDLWFI